MSASIPRARKFLDRNLPALSSIMSGKLAGKEAGDSVRRLFIRSFTANSLALGFWGISVVIRSTLPSLAELAHQAGHIAHPIVTHMTAAQLTEKLARPLALLAATGGMLGTSAIAVKRDYQFLKAVFGTVQTSAIGLQPEEEPGYKKGILATLAQRAQITLTGFRLDKSLRRKMIACSAVEVISDALDTYASATQNPLAWAGSVAISETVGLKVLDLTLRGYRVGLLAEEAGADVPVSVRLLQAMNLKEKAETILAELPARPKLTNVLNKTDSAVLGFAASAPFAAARNIADYAMTGDTVMLKNSAMLVGGSLALSGTCALASGALLAYTYGMRNRQQLTVHE